MSKAKRERLDSSTDSTNTIKYLLCARHCFGTGAYKLSPAFITFLLKHPFVKSAKGVSILRDLINEAMDVKLKRQEAQQREVDHEDEENSVSGRPGFGPQALMLIIS